MERMPGAQVEVRWTAPPRAGPFFDDFEMQISSCMDLVGIAKVGSQLVLPVRYNRTRVALPATNQTQLFTQQTFVYTATSLYHNTANAPTTPALQIKFEDQNRTTATSHVAPTRIAMTTPTQTTTSDAPPRPTLHIRADGTCGRRIRYPPRPRPTPKSPSCAQIKELCAIWKFKEWRELPTEHFDRAQTYLYDIRTGPLGSEASRRWLLHCALLTAIENVIAALGFPGMGTVWGTKYTYTAYYTNDDEISVLPEWLQELVMVEKSSLDGYTPE